MKSPEQVVKNPLLSVVVPVYNASRDLERCLTALEASQFEDFDVCVVDDGSTEPIEPIVKRYGFSYLRIEGPRGPAYARNRGALRAPGEYLVFIDADIEVHEDTLARIAAVFAADTSVAGVIGCYDDKPDDTGFVSQYKNIFHHYVHQDSHGDVPTFWSGCGAMRREVFMEFGGFDEVRYQRPAIEDIELGTWVSAAGHRILLDGGILCCHLKRWTFSNLLKTDIFDRGIPWTRLMIRAGTSVNTLNVKGSQRVSVALVYLTLAGIAVAVWFPYAWFAVAGLFLAVTAINRDFYRYFAARRGWGFALRVLPLHWLYFLYCGVSVVAGTLSHYLSGEDRNPPHRGPLTDVDGA